MGTKKNPGAFDCYGRAKDDEPMFVLLGRDRHAPLLVLRWAQMRENAGESPAVVKAARECASEMRRWNHNLKTRLQVGASEDTPCWIEKERDQLLLMTRELEAHPEGYEGPCLCRICQAAGS